MEIDIENIKENGYTLEKLLEILNLKDKRTVVMGTEAIHKLYDVDYFQEYSAVK